MNKLGILLLTSTGLFSKNVKNKFEEIRSQRNYKKAVLITTASEGKENNEYCQTALTQLKSVGLETLDFYDFEDDKPRDMSSYDVIYVCGGNTFRLMKFAKKANFNKDILELLERGGAYIGVSAGSLIVGPSIQIANEVHPDKNEVNLTDYTGFNIVNFTVFPHYSSDLEKEIQEFEERNNTKIKRIDNSQAILVENKENTLI